jgi:hypothetical protein
VGKNATTGILFCAFDFLTLSFAHAQNVPADAGLVLTQMGFNFEAIQGGGTPPSKSFRVFNATSHPLNFTVATSTLSGGAWLNASPSTPVWFTLTLMETDWSGLIEALNAGCSLRPSSHRCSRSAEFPSVSDNRSRSLSDWHE